MWPLAVSAFLLCPPFMVSITEARAASKTTGLDPVPGSCAGLLLLQHYASPQWYS